MAVIHGDCRDVLPGMKADLILTDPPYGSTPQKWDRWPDGWLEAAAKVTRSLWCFGSARMFLDHGAEFTAAGWKFAEDIVWEKHNGSGPGSSRRFLRVHELVYHWYLPPWKDIYACIPRVSRTGPQRAPAKRVAENTIHQGTYGDDTWTDDGTRLARSVIKARNMHRKGIHTAQKPEDLLRILIKASCPPEGTVIDPFCGSGAILKTAESTGRQATGIELEACGT